MIRLAAAATWLLAAHAALNAALLRDPPAASKEALDHNGQPSPADAPHSHKPQISVLVPARNEAARIGPCLSALLASAHVDIEIIVLDDGSTDDTSAVAAAVAAGDPRARILSGQPLPEGWLGKPHACAQLAAAARGDVLAFVDADVVVAPDGLARSVALLDAGPLDMVCPYPRQIVDRPATRLVQPLLQWSWLTFLPLRIAERSPRPSLVAANGQLLLCRARDYHKIGGHATVRDAVLEDLELARAFKRAGLTAGVVAGHEIASCAMYRTWEELRSGYTKSLWAAFGSPVRAAAVLALLVALYVAPPVAGIVGLARGDPRLTRRALWATAGGVLSRVTSARRTGGISPDAVWHPLSVLQFAWLTYGSFRARARDELSWRGRRLPPRPPVRRDLG